MKKVLLLILVLIILFPLQSIAVSLGQQLSGQILLDVERNGEAWYVFPNDNKRYYLGRPTDAFQIMRELGVGITEVNFQKIAQAGMPIDGDLALTKRLSGKIILQVEKNGEAWYINPEDLKKYYLGRPNDAFQIMRELGLGITRENLAKIHKPGTKETLNQYSKYEFRQIDTKDGRFSIDMVEIDLKNPNLNIITDVAEPYPSSSRDKNMAYYGATTLAKMVLENKGFAGMNGTYFCSSGGCGAQNYYFFPVYDTDSGILVNDDQLKYWTTGPIIVFDQDNKFYYFKDSREFKSVEFFEETFETKIQALIGNKPRLIENKMDLLIEWDIDDNQRNIRSFRNAIAYKEDVNNPGYGTIYLVVVRNATVPNLANIMKAMDVDYALNLDGGYSSALWYNDEYMVLPGRDIPNAIIFQE